MLLFLPPPQRRQKKQPFSERKLMKKAKWCLKNIEEIIGGIAISVMLLATGYNVLMRYIFKSPTSWSDELSMISLAYATFVGGAAAYKRNAHFGMDYLVDKLPSSAQTFLRRTINLILIVLFAAITYLGVVLTKDTVKCFPYTRWSYKYMDAALPIGFFSMACHSIGYFIQSFTDPAAYRRRYEQMYDDSDEEHSPISDNNAGTGEERKGGNAQ